tara:strand:+ start:202 stop:537 length:336 start_codon:yes stop_codon:yes gene_type:complete
VAIDRLRTLLWVQAQMRLCSQRNQPLYIKKKGDPDAGIIFVQLNKLDGTNELFTQIRGAEGILNWVPVSDKIRLNDIEVDEYLEKQKVYDPDIWIIEVEDPNDKFCFIEKA